MTFYVDPSLTPETGRQRAIADLVQARGLWLVRVRPGHYAVRLTGPGVHVVAASFDRLSEMDCHPPTGRFK